MGGGGVLEPVNGETLRFLLLYVIGSYNQVIKYSEDIMVLALSKWPINISQSYPKPNNSINSKLQKSFFDLVSRTRCFLLFSFVSAVRT